MRSGAAHPFVIECLYLLGCSSIPHNPQFKQASIACRHRPVGLQ